MKGDSFARLEGVMSSLITSVGSLASRLSPRKKTREINRDFLGMKRDLHQAVFGLKVETGRCSPDDYRAIAEILDEFQNSNEDNLLTFCAKQPNLLSLFKDFHKENILVENLFKNPKKDFMKELDANIKRAFALIYYGKFDTNNAYIQAKMLGEAELMNFAINLSKLILENKLCDFSALERSQLAQTIFDNRDLAVALLKKSLIKEKEVNPEFDLAKAFTDTFTSLNQIDYQYRLSNIAISANIQKISDQITTAFLTWFGIAGNSDEKNEARRRSFDKVANLAIGNLDWDNFFGNHLQGYFDRLFQVIFNSEISNHLSPGIKAVLKIVEPDSVKIKDAMNKFLIPMLISFANGKKYQASVDIDEMNGKHDEYFANISKFVQPSLDQKAKQALLAIIQEKLEVYIGRLVFDCVDFETMKVDANNVKLLAEFIQQYAEMNIKQGFTRIK